MAAPAPRRPARRQSLVKLRGAVYYENFSVKGHRFRGCLGTGDRDLADTLAAAKRAEALLGKITGQKPEITLAQAVVRFWNERAQHWRTARQGQIHNRTLLDHLGADMLLSGISFGQLSEFVALRRASLENASVNREIAHLRSIVNACDAWGYRVAAAIPWRSSRGPSLWLDEPDNKQTLLPDDVEDIFLAQLRPDFRAVVKFGLMTGLRRENALGLKWSQIDWDSGTITFRVKSKRPGGKLHMVDLTAGLKALLSRERGNHPEYVFTYVCEHSGPRHHKGARYPLAADGGNFRRAWLRAREAVGLPTLRFHDLRHTFGTRLAALAPIGVVREALAHSDIRTTMRYATTSRQQVREAMERLERTQIRHKPVSAQPKKRGGSNA